MANWVKGKLKIRGKPEDIKRWVEECLHCYFTKWFRDGSYEDELVDDAVVFEHDPKAREMRLDTIEDAYIEGTKRNFVEKGVYGDSYREDEKPILVVSMKAAWNVDETPYIEILISWGGDDVARDSGAGLLLDVPPVTGGNLVYFLVKCCHGVGSFWF